jgi:protein TonB
MSFLIDVDGQVSEAKVKTSSGHSRLDDAALAAISKCRFKPGTSDGIPRKAWTQLLYKWDLAR